MASNLKDIYVGVNKADKNRRSNDFYPTPPLPTYILCKYGNVPDSVLEPCAGRGNISIELQRNGKRVVSRDLHAYENSLVEIETGIGVLESAKADTEALITNPPYEKNLPALIAEHGINNYTYTALFVRLTYLEGMKRLKLFRKHPPSKVIVFSDRIKFGEYNHEPIEKDEQIGGMICYCWVIFDSRVKSSDTLLTWVSASEEYDEWREKYDTWMSSKI